MKDSKNLKSQSKNDKMSEQTPSPAVPNRAHTEMKNGNGASNSKNKNSSNKQSSK